MIHSLYLITGPAASGKTAVSTLLTERGYNTLEADSTPGLAYFVNKNNKPVPYPAGADASWWSSHSYVWETDRLKNMLNKIPATDKPVFVCGTASNIDNIWNIFKAAFYLDIPADLIESRLNANKETTSFSARIDERAQLMRWAEAHKEAMISKGAISIDATQPVATVTDNILARIKAETN